jgi:drug/metabolite transporter (DMT)-like permease
MTAAAILAAAALPALPQPHVASWPLILASAVFQIVYFVLLARTYQLADMSQVYPLMRGTAPLLVALVSALILGTHLNAIMWIGIGVICFGILSMAAGGGRSNRQGMVLALINAGVIAAYTVIDGIGVRRSGAPVAYTLWLFLISGALFAAGVLRARGRIAVVSYCRQHWHLGLIGGAGSLVSYCLALWAMTGCARRSRSGLTRDFNLIWSAHFRIAA